MINVAVPLLSEFYQAPKPETFNHAWSLLVPKGNQFPVINVVGTNGKGTVTNVLGAYCQKKFKKVGIFQSPVLNHHNNRIKINNHAISDAKIWCYYYRYYQVWVENRLSFFQIWTLMMVMLFNDQNVDLAIIEAGIGGEHDSTAKLNHQQLVVLTSVSKDHTKILGHNLNDIIRTKIGIIHHPSTPLVVAPSNLCHQNLITQVHTKTIFAQPNHAVVLTFKNNLFLQDNLSTVLAVISYLKWHLPSPAVLGSKLPPGRFVQKAFKTNTLIIDGAHNPDAVHKLILTVARSYPKTKKIKFLVGCNKKKNYFAFIEMLIFHRCRFYLTTFDHQFAVLPSQFPSHLPFVADWKTWITKQKDHIIVCCGSFYFINLVLSWLN